MRKLTVILRLRFEAELSHRAIARSVDIGLGTVSLYLKRFQASGLSWPLSAQMDEVQLTQQLFANGALEHATGAQSGREAVCGLCGTNGCDRQPAGANAERRKCLWRY